MSHVSQRIGLLILFSMLATTAVGADVFQTRTSDPDGHDAFVPVDLSALANDNRPVAYPDRRVNVLHVPFNAITGGEANHLFLKPIGWSDAKDESAAYPGYIANYDQRDKAKEDKARAVVQIPVADYAAVWMLASTDNDETLSDVVTFRFGILNGQARTTYYDFEARVPRAADPAGASKAAQTIKTDWGNLYVIRVPIAMALAQEFPEQWALDLDITKQLRIAVNQPDPYRYQIRPLGTPSGVRIFALTLERSSMQMAVAGRELGNVFNQPQKPAFDIVLRNHFEHYLPYHFEAIVTAHDGEKTVHKFPEFRNWAPVYQLPAYNQSIELPITQRGHYSLRVNLKKGDSVVSWHDTTFAILAPNTRKHRDTSPFGAWDFAGTHGTPSDRKLRGELAVKAGWKYLGNLEEYGVETMVDPAVHNPGAIDGILKEMEANPGKKPPKRVLVFHETAVSGSQVTRTPDIFTGKKYKFDAAEQKTFDHLWQLALTSSKRVRELWPDTEIYVGNGVPHMIEDLIRRGFPRELLTIAGNESGSFMRPPEAQPLDFVANNAGLWMFRQVLDQYGYAETKLYQCFEICYPSSNPGNLTEWTQARYFARHIMHSLAWRVPLIRPGSLTDMSNSYYHSNWGSTGFCHAWPTVSPKPAYVAYAVLTQALDGATLVGPIDTGSPVVYAVQFKNPEDLHVTCFWTPRGTREVSVQVPRAERKTLMDMMGRETEVAFSGGKATITVSADPVYLFTGRPIKAVTLGTVTHEPPPAGETFVISKLDKLAEWTIESQRSSELEVFNFMCPRRKGEFAYRETASFEGMNGMLEVTPTLPVAGEIYLPMYSVLAHNQGVAIPGEPTQIGAWVNGNGGWGRLIFELTDAAGQRWISIGAEQGGAPNPWMADWLSPEEFKNLKGSNVSDWNSDDAWGRSVVNHEGWRFVRFPMPGQYPGEGYHWPRNSQWRCVKADGSAGDNTVHYPLTFRKLVVTIPQNVLQLTEYKPVPRQTIYLKDLAVSYLPIEEAIKE